MNFLDRLIPQRLQDLSELPPLTALIVPQDSHGETRTQGPVINPAERRCHPLPEDPFFWIAEIKRSSPSKGKIAADNAQTQPVQLAQGYVQAGASILSVLTEPHFFNGSFEILAAVRQAVPHTPLLMKDFLLTPEQLLRGYLAGADLFLLIVALLKPEVLLSLYHQGSQLGMTPLIEIHSLTELEQLAKWVSEGRLPAPPLVGVNHRCLRQLTLHPERSAELYPRLREAFPETRLIAESGLQTPEDVARVHNLGYQGALIGSALMETPDPALTLKQWKPQTAQAHLTEVSHV